MFTITKANHHAVCLMDQGGSVMTIENDITGTLRRETHGHEPVVMQPIAFDMAQITSKANGSRAEPGLPTGTLAKGSSMHVAQAVYELHSQDSRVSELGDVCCTVSATYGAGGGNVPVTIQPIGIFQDSEFGIAQYDTAGTLRAGRIPAHQMAIQPIGLDEEQNAMVDAFGTLKARTAGGGFEGSVMQTNMAVRRLTPVECERLQGFPDGYTDIQPKGKATPDGPRYKALGNSMAVPVMAWIGKRIQQVEDILG
jgi:DNA (cytosine-5)-methyltransferase 1